jgi:signal transduction histidine kinase
MKLPVRLRLTLWYVALLAAALLLFAGSVYVLMSRSLLDNLDTSLHQRINQLVPTVDVANGRIRLPPVGEEPDTPYIPAALLSPSGRSLRGALPPALRPWLQQRGVSLPHSFTAQTVGDFRIATTAIEGNSHRVGYLLVWQPLGSVDAARRSLLLLMLATGPGLLLLTGIGGILLARRAFSPVAQITHTASRISATDLHRRVPVGRTQDELSELATTFNAMIERLEAAVQRERDFTADASHELRSPLAVILAETSLALEESLDAEDSRRAMGIIHEQATSMNEMIYALLTLTRVETIGAHREIVPLVEVVDRAVRQCALTAREREVDVTAGVAAGLFVHAEPALLIRAVRNVLDNAIKASPSGSAVDIQAHRDGSSIVLEIRDDGPGIGSDDLERIFEPFYQVEKARTPGDSHGLGLAICRRIVAAHGGEVTADSRIGEGACFRIILPAAGVVQSIPDIPEVVHGRTTRMNNSSSSVHGGNLQ